MARRVTYELKDGTRVQFETEPVDGWQQVGADEVIAKIDEAVSPVVAGAAALLDRLKEAGPEGVEVKFGVKVSGTVNWLIAKAATEANFEVTLTWSPGAAPGPADVRPAG